MEDFGFDIEGILSEEEAEKLFEEQEQEPKKEPEPEVNDTVAEVKEDEPEPEGVGEEEVEEEASRQKSGGSSPSVYSSIAKALKKDGIFPDFEDSELDGVSTAEDFAELFEKAISSRQSEDQRRVSEALNNGVQPDVVKNYEQTISYLDSIEDDQISDEGESGENLRRQLIYNDLINRGYSEDKAKKELEKSFRTGSDVEDAKDALDALRSFYKGNYDKVRADAKKRAEDARQAQKKQAEEFKKMIIDDELKLGDIVLDKNTKQKVYDAVTKPVFKDPKSGRLLTEVQKFQVEHPDEFIKQLGMWFVLTNGGKDVSALIKGKVRAEKNKGIRELERKINSTSLNTDGSLKLVSGSGGGLGNDILLSDDWSIG